MTSKLVISEHNQLGGLPADDHVQYALLAGRPGGQTLTGGTDPGDDLVFHTTTNAIKGKIFFGIRAVFEDDVIIGPRLGIGTVTPNEPIHAHWDIDGNVGVRIENPNTGPLAVCRMIVKPDVGAGGFVGYGSGFAADGSRKPSSVSVVANASMPNGLSLVSRSATANMSFYTGGYQDAQERMYLGPGGELVLLSNNGGKLYGGDSSGGDLYLQGRNDSPPGIVYVNSPMELGDNDTHFNDAGAVVFGTDDDVRVEWDNAAGAWNWNPAVGEDLGITFGLDGSKPTYLLEAETFGDSETDYTQIRFGFDRYAFGQTGSIGNQVGLFVAGNRTVEATGDWSDYLLTQTGSLNIGTFSMSDVAAWTINSISLDNTAGSISSLDTMVVGGMTTSNPGITVTERSALRVRGRKKQEGSVQYPPINPTALSAGDNDDWAGLLTGSPSNNGRFWARITGNATTSNLTGIDATAVQDGDTFEMTNVGSENILLVPEDTGSVAANRIVTEDGFNHVVKPDGTVGVRYDATTLRWRVTTAPGNVAPLTGFWRFSTSTTMADPGSGSFRQNNATPASVTSLALSDISFRGGDLSNILGLVSSGDTLYLQQSNNGANYLKFNVTGTTDNTTWFQIDGTVSSSGTIFDGNQEVAITVIFA